ncbi:MAG: hypothetical protein HQL45_08740 [Alphaproteobacteria bacterium]|nr:hypothetical protein [Alphaproteobacteria bacterium]
MTRMGTLVFFVFFLTAWSSNAQAIDETPVLDVLDDCPAQEPTCVAMSGYLNWPGKRADSNAKHPAVRAARMNDPNPDFPLILIRVKGRLNGGEERTYDLRTISPTDALGCHDFNLPALGARAGGGGILLTHQGKFTMTSREISFGSRTSLVVIPDNFSKATYHLSPGWERYSWVWEPIITKMAQVYWSKNGICLDLDNPSHFRRIDSEKCISEPLVPADAADIQRLGKSKLLGSTAMSESSNFEILRLKDHSWLIYIWSVACT